MLGTGRDKQKIEMNKALAVLSIGILLISCSQKAPSKEDKIKEVTEVYLVDFFKEETNLTYEIDTLIIKEVTSKVELSNKALYLKKVSNKKLEKAKELGKEYQILPIKSTKEKFEELQTEIIELHERAKELAQKSQIADSTKILYYDVVVRNTMTSTTNNVQKKGVFPFHISTDYKIIGEPLDLRKKQLEIQ